MKRLLDDCHAQAMTEYVIIMGVVVTFCIYLYHPDNGIYGGIREIYDNTMMLLLLPGP